MLFGVIYSATSSFPLPTLSPSSLCWHLGPENHQPTPKTGLKVTSGENTLCRAVNLPLPICDFRSAATCCAYLQGDDFGGRIPAIQFHSQIEREAGLRLGVLGLLYADCLLRLSLLR